MYKIYIDGSLAYSPYEKEFAVYDANLSVEQNQPDTFEFTLPFTNPFVNSIEKMCTEVRLLRDDELMFVGVACEDTLNFDNSRTVKCKGDLYFLSQSIIRPYSFQGSVKDYFKLLIDAHNAESERKFYVGSVTVTDPNDYITRASSDYPTVYKEITDKCIGLLGGYLVMRYVDGKRYIDYLDDYNTVNEQTVEFAMNISDVTVDSDVLEMATVLIPRGANIESGGTEEDQQSAEERIDITSVNDGKDYIQDDEAVARYGRIMKVETWDDVTIPENLLKKAKKRLKEISSMTKVITLKAVDVSAVRNVSSFSLHQYIHVISKPNGIDDLYLPTKIDMSIFSPESNSIELTVSSMTRNETSARRTVHGSFIDTTGSVENNTFDKLNRIVEDYSTKINQQKDSISTEVARTKKEMIDYTDKSLNDYYTKDETVSRISQEADRVNSLISKVQSALVGTVNRLVELNKITAKTKPSDDSVIKFERNNLKLGYASDGAFELYKIENFTGLYNDSKTHSLLAVVRTEDNSSQSITIKAGNRTSTAKIDGDYTRITIDSISFADSKSISVSCTSGVYLCFDKLRLIEADKYVDIAEGITSLTNSVTETQGTVEFISSQLDTLKSDIDGASETSKRIKKYVIFNEDPNDASLTLCTSRNSSGKPTGFTMKLTPKALNFYQNYGDTEPIAYLTNSNLYITKAVVVQSYRVGHHIWTATKTDLGEDMLVLDYIGGGA